MSIFDKYLTASFRGIVFFLDSESVDDGRKTVTHDFVNSDRRFVEDLGKIPIIFNINGFVFGDPGFAERDALRTALNVREIGRLVHPLYGNVDVVADPFAISSTMRDAGRFNFRMVFKTQTSNKEPFVRPSRGIFGDTLVAGQQNVLVTPSVSLTENQDFATNSQLAETAQEGRDAAAESAEEIFEVATDQNYFDQIEEVYLEGIARIREVTETIEDAALRSVGLTEVGKLFNDPPGFLSNPEILFPELNSLYQQISSAGIFNRWVEAAGDFADLFSLGDNTKRSQDISRSYGSLVSNFQVNALVNAYQSAVTTDFSTVDDLEEAESTLNDLFQDIVNNPIDNSIITNVNFPDLKTDLLQMRSTSKIIFTQKEQNAFKVVTFDSKTRSILQTTYDLYGSLDKLTSLANLNQGVNASNPPTPLQVLEAP